LEELAFVRELKDFRHRHEVEINEGADLVTVSGFSRE
jgi:hypothetical protein